MTSARGERLYALVEAYSALGDHRTASPADAATRGWLAAELTARGGDVDEHGYEFDAYDAHASVHLGGRAVACLPVAYAGTGSVDTAEPVVASVDTGITFEAEVDAVLANAASEGAPAVLVVTRGAGGRLVAVNRAPAAPAGPIAVAIGERDAQALGTHSARVTARARVARASSATVVGRFGAEDAGCLVVTTPISGWFRCAGERGTGIAVALEVVSCLAPDLPVLVVATTGHEIGFLGAKHYLAGASLAPAAVLHLGAGLAAGDGHDLGAPRAALVDGIDPDARAQLEAALARGELPTLALDGPWPTEGEDWRALGAPVLSLVGGFDRFHTSDDLPRQVTSPALLDRVFGAVYDATRVLVACAEGRRLSGR